MAVAHPRLVEADLDDARDPGGGGARDQRVGLPGERLVVQVGVGVYEFHGGIIP